MTKSTSKKRASNRRTVDSGLAGKAAFCFPTKPVMQILQECESAFEAGDIQRGMDLETELSSALNIRENDWGAMELDYPANLPQLKTAMTAVAGRSIASQRPKDRWETIATTSRSGLREAPRRQETRKCDYRDGFCSSAITRRKFPITSP